MFFLWNQGNVQYRWRLWKIRGLRTPALPLLKSMDLSTVPVIRERVKLAKKIFLQSFLVII
jgi:hypothetical protein